MMGDQGLTETKTNADEMTGEEKRDIIAIRGG